MKSIYNYIQAIRFNSFLDEFYRVIQSLRQISIIIIIVMRFVCSIIKLKNMMVVFFNILN